MGMRCILTVFLSQEPQGTAEFLKSGLGNELLLVVHVNEL